MLGQMYLGSKNTGTQDEKGTFSLEDPARSPLITKKETDSFYTSSKGDKKCVSFSSKGALSTTQGG